MDESEKSDITVSSGITRAEWLAEIERVEQAAQNKKSQAEEALYQKAVKLVLETRNARNTFLRHKLKISQRKTFALIERMTEEGILGPYKRSNIPREILK